MWKDLYRDADVEASTDGFTDSWAGGQISSVHEPKMGWGAGGLYFQHFTLNVGCGITQGLRPWTATHALFLVPCSLFLVPCSLFFARCSLLVARCSLFVARCSLLLASCFLPHPSALTRLLFEHLRGSVLSADGAGSAAARARGEPSLAGVGMGSAGIQPRGIHALTRRVQWLKGWNPRDALHAVVRVLRTCSQLLSCPLPQPACSVAHTGHLLASSLLGATLLGATLTCCMLSPPADPRANSKVFFFSMRRQFFPGKPTPLEKQPVMVHMNYHPDKHKRMLCVWERYVNERHDACDSLPQGG